jgi:hypoxanthine phosphoribosyltransferase
VKVPENYTLIYDSEFIRERVAELALEIQQWLVAEKLDGQLLAVCVLRGATFFYSDLLRQLDVSVEPSYCFAQSYDPESNTQSGEFVSSAEKIEVSKRCVLLVDDICDTGKTLEHLSKSFIESGAQSVRTAVLINRKIKSPKFEPDWSGIEHVGDEWFVGFGMDDKNAYANLPQIYVLEKSK